MTVKILLSAATVEVLPMVEGGPPATKVSLASSPDLDADGAPLGEVLVTFGAAALQGYELGDPEHPMLAYGFPAAAAAEGEPATFLMGFVAQDEGGVWVCYAQVVATDPAAPPPDPVTSSVVVVQRW